MAKAYSIKKSTLKNISNAIRIFHLKRLNPIQGTIPVNEFADALRNGVVKTQAPEATSVKYVINEQTLKELADTIRDIGGSTDKITISDFENTIINLAIRLDKPIINIVSVEVEESQTGTTISCLTTPIIFIKSIEIKDELTDALLSTLDHPIISLVNENIDQGDIKDDLTKLDTPVISVLKYNRDTASEPDYSVEKLIRPNPILIKEYGGEIDDDCVSIKLETPNIKLTLDYSGDKNSSVLGICILGSAIIGNDGTKESQKVNYLHTPKINIIKFNFKEREEITSIPKLSNPETILQNVTVNDDIVIDNIIPSVALPDISIERSEYVVGEVSKPIIPKLSFPKINLIFDSIIDGEYTPSTSKLDSPIIDVLHEKFVDTGENDILTKISRPMITLSIGVLDDQVDSNIAKLITPIINLELIGTSKENSSVIGTGVIGSIILGNADENDYDNPEKLAQVDTPTIVLINQQESDFQESVKLNKLCSPTIELIIRQENDFQESVKLNKLYSPTIELKMYAHNQLDVPIIEVIKNII